MSGPRAADGRAVVCRLVPHPAGLVPGRKIALLVGDRIHLRGGGVPGNVPIWKAHSRALGQVEVLRDATPHEVLTGMIGAD